MTAERDARVQERAPDAEDARSVQAYRALVTRALSSEIVGFLASSGLKVREVPVTILYTDYSRSKGQSLINGVNILFDLSVRQRGA